MYSHLIRELGHFGKYYSLPDLNDVRYETLPFCIRILLESAIRNCDGFEVTKNHAEYILDWGTRCKLATEIPFKPSRVLLQDLTGVPAEVDLAAMRDAVARFGHDPKIINPLVPVDLIIDHSVQVDVSSVPGACTKNQEIEFERNKERFAFLKWAAGAFENMLIVPPGSGIVHQVNLEYLARGVFTEKGMLYPDSLVGTDSHTTMINGLGIAGWGVGGIEAEAVMLGQPISMTLPEVVGFELVGSLPLGTTATDLALKVTQLLREKKVVGKFVEFFGTGCQQLSVADRATISNMSPEYGATMGYFPVDQRTLTYFKLSGRTNEQVAMIEQYCKAQKIFRQYNQAEQKIQYTCKLRYDLSELIASIAGPKRPHDFVPLSVARSDFVNCLTSKVGFKGYGLTPEQAADSAVFSYHGKSYEFKHGSIVIAAITSCTNTSNPHVMVGAGLIAKKAVELGLNVKPYIKRSLSPGSLIVTKYLEMSNLMVYLENLGFYVTGYGCQTCIGNSGDLCHEVLQVIDEKNFVAAAVLSGNRNFEGRIHPFSRANYLMSPMMVIIYALAGTMDFDLYKDPLGYTSENKPIYMQDLLPQTHEISDIIAAYVVPDLYKQVYSNIAHGGSEAWRKLSIPTGELYRWNPKSTYIHDPPYLKTMEIEPTKPQNVVNARCLLLLGDSVTTDHISPAGAIARGSPASKFLDSLSVSSVDYNTYGSRRGNDLIMVRGTFANNRLINRLVNKVGPYTNYFPQNKNMFLYDAAMLYKEDNTPLIVIAGKDYGSGSSRDWAAKGPNLLGIRVVLAQSYERIHRSNLIGMGIIPLQFQEGESADTLNLKGDETYTFNIDCIKQPAQMIAGQVVRPNGEQFTIMTLCRLDTLVDLEYFKHGGILPYVLRKLIREKKN